MKHIGWIGLGNMGKPMANNLFKTGFPLTVFNRSAAKTKSFENTNVIIAQNISELVGHSDIIFTMLSNDEAVSMVYEEIFGMEEISGKLFIDMSTISEELSVGIAQKMKQGKASFLDAPVAGSTQPAANGALTIMVGGDVNDLTLALPYFEKLGKFIKHVGPNGKGIATKLSVNYFLSILYLGLAETVLFAEKNGVNRSDLLEIINESACGSGATKVKTPLLINEDYKPAFALSLMQKDIMLAQKNGVNFPLTNAIIETYSEAIQSGLGNQDVISVINYLKEK
ncbi:NAD(P)-dependent oxidoreductase [Flavobacterium franklandianum]|uniref:NAD(P)-dependent oxidoreductase n=2 Tax=Flavobacterium TaxID=237 RepID=A0A3S0M6Y3_9FLAO|nr:MULTISPECIES: NAD(P)-dependent oxidoreductase [Flavobacterium]RTY97763.1 NAD(P)-dependent oxidoreductase [Flavobacterium bomense]TRX22066.1 NAD(P)-dependent oxidoreductase [Flavobacterium franklandianum]TRX28711.1 NAD(P)-dependent oxidoreductase [Flavobacterium franklandianum]